MTENDSGSALQRAVAQLLDQLGEWDTDRAVVVEHELASVWLVGEPVGDGGALEATVSIVPTMADVASVHGFRVEISGPDGSVVSQSLGRRGTARFPGLSRGRYRVALAEGADPATETAPALVSGASPEEGPGSPGSRDALFAALALLDGTGGPHGESEGEPAVLPEARRLVGGAEGTPLPLAALLEAEVRRLSSRGPGRSGRRQSIGMLVDVKVRETVRALRQTSSEPELPTELWRSDDGVLLVACLATGTVTVSATWEADPEAAVLLVSCPVRLRDEGRLGERMLIALRRNLVLDPGGSSFVGVVKLPRPVVEAGAEIEGAEPSFLVGEDQLAQLVVDAPGRRAVVQSVELAGGEETVDAWRRLLAVPGAPAAFVEAVEEGIEARSSGG